MEQLKPPTELSFEGNIAENWKRWLQAFEIFLIASGINGKEEKIQCATFLHVAGEQARTIYNSFSFTTEEKDKIDVLKAKFKSYCEPRTNLTYIRHQFFTRTQGPLESTDAFVADLKNKAKGCKFEGLNESLIKDRIVCGIRSDEVRSRLLRDPKLDLQTAIDTCRASESTFQIKLQNTRTNGIK